MGIILVYDITNQRSFDNITKWLRNIDEVSRLLATHELKYCIGCSYSDSHLLTYTFLQRIEVQVMDADILILI